jgi:hypothetical protein
VRSGVRDVAGAEVSVSFGVGNQHHRQSSDEQGEFRFEGLLPGLWRVQVRGDDRLVRATTEVSLPEGQEQRIELVLSDTHVVAHVRRAEDGAPLANATVRLKSAEPAPAAPASPDDPWVFGSASGPKALGKAVTGPDGVARFGDVPPGHYALTTEADGRLPAEQVLDVAASTGELVVTLDAPLAARVEGTVFAADEGVLHVRVRVQPFAPGAEAVTGSVADNHFLVDHLPDGPARVWVEQRRINGFPPQNVELASMQVELRTGETAQADFTVQPIRKP